MATKKIKRKTVSLIKGSNKKLDDIEFAINNIESPPGYENASGFYTLDSDKEENLITAIEYADYITNITGEGHPTVNYYVLDLSNAIEDLTGAYYDSLDPESLHYVGENINDLFPKHCRWYNTTDDSIKPITECHKCSVYNCERNADYIESILSDAKGTYNLDEILTELIFNEITEEDALQQINELLNTNGVKIRIQITLRPRVLKYLHFITSKTKEEVLRDGS